MFFSVFKFFALKLVCSLHMEIMQDNNMTSLKSEKWKNSLKSQIDLIGTCLVVSVEDVKSQFRCRNLFQ